MWEASEGSSPGATTQATYRSDISTRHHVHNTRLLPDFHKEEVERMVVGLSKKAAKPVTRVQDCVSSFVSVKTTLSLSFVGTKTGVTSQDVIFSSP